MKIKPILIGTILTVGGYCVGKLVGSIKTINAVLDVADERFPGSKKHVVNTVADKVIDVMFDEVPEEEESK